MIVVLNIGSEETVGEPTGEKEDSSEYRWEDKTWELKPNALGELL